MLPGLVLTVGLIAQSSIGALVTRTAPNPDAPRFINIGDSIIQSATAKPIAPVGVCGPVAPEPPLVVREYVVVQAPPEEPADVAPPVEEQPVDDGVVPVAMFPVGGYPFAARQFPRRSPHQHPSVATHHAPPTAHAALQPVMLPAFPTVLLPPQPTVLLPPGFSHR